MRSIYAYIIFFIAWCSLSAWWYVLYVKGLTTNPTDFSPHENTVAIAEILVMMLVALLFGFGMAWQLRQSQINQKEAKLEKLASELKVSGDENLNLELTNRKLENKLKSGSKAFESDLNKSRWEMGQLLEDFKKHREMSAKRLSEEQASFQSRIKELQASLDLQNYREKQHIHQVDELKATIVQLEEKLTEVTTRRNRNEPVFSDFIVDQRLGEPFDKEPEEDDLKKIKGIGPVIEKKLKEIGISTYAQIMEFDEWSIQKVGDAIKYFPDRILRDDWIGQAVALEEENHRGT